MFESVSFYIASALLGLGLIYRFSTWFRYNLCPKTQGVSPGGRLAIAARGAAGTIFSRKIFTLFKVFILDVVLQLRVLRRSPFRWCMHMLLYAAFLVLLLFHALDDWVSAELFSGYYSTVNPYLFLRELAGVLVIAGLLMAAYRRYAKPGRRPPTRAADSLLLVLVAVIIGSGIVLEAVKITSHSIYKEMVRDFTFGLEEPQARALEAYWVEHFGVVSPDLKPPFDEKLLQDGAFEHEMSCKSCHSKPQWAFAGYGASKLIEPAALSLDSVRADRTLWMIHYMACLLALAFLPFTKLFHVFTAPLSLLLNAVMNRQESHLANIATKQIIELDACVHCGACTQACSVAVTHALIPNPNILPSEKIPGLKALASGKPLDHEQIRIIQQGLHLCSNCNRCKEVCPVGIDLADMWFTARELLLKRSVPEYLLLSPFSLYRGLIVKNQLDEDEYENPLQTARGAFANGHHEGQPDSGAAKPLIQAGNVHLFNGRRGAIVNFEDYGRCFRCMTCSSACPVVNNYDRPKEVLGMLPHQIMHAARLRLWDMIFESRMLWDCLGCYKCQEYCPQNVRIADVLYQIKNHAIARSISHESSNEPERKAS